jgi:hypothetical protein
MTGSRPIEFSSSLTPINPDLELYTRPIVHLSLGSPNRSTHKVMSSQRSALESVIYLSQKCLDSLTSDHLNLLHVEEDFLGAEFVEKPMY